MTNTATKEEYEEMEVSFQELADMIGIDDLSMPELYEIEDQGYEILSVDPETGKDVWKPIQNFIVKPGQSTHYNLDGLSGTGEHRVKHNGEWTKLKDHPDTEEINEEIQVVDLTVKDTHTYKCGGQLNHNTTTPGGMAIPYAASTRIRITSTGQKQIKDKDGNVIGILVKAKTIKNKVARPFRSVDFEIHFGVGVVEHEQVFDAFRAHCTKEGPVLVGDKLVNIEGTGAWKTFVISNQTTGEVEIETKFHKSDFGNKFLYVPEFKKYVDALYESTFIMTTHSKEHQTFEGVNSDSYTENAAVVMEAAEAELRAEGKL